MTTNILESDYLRPFVARFHALYGDAPNATFLVWIQRKWAKFYALHPAMPRGTADTRTAFLAWLETEEA